MSSKKKESTPAPQVYQDPALTSLLNTQAQNAAKQSDLSTALYGDEAALLSTLLQGRQPPGIYSTLGQGYGSGVENAIFNRNRDEAYAALANAGLLDSGVRAELENQAATDVSIASADRARNDLLQLMQMGIGGAPGMYGAANQSMGTGISGLSSRENQLNQFNQQNWIAQMNYDAQRRAANSAMWSGLFGGIGSLGAGLLNNGLFNTGRSNIPYSYNPNYDLVNGRVVYTGR